MGQGLGGGSSVLQNGAGGCGGPPAGTGVTEGREGLWQDVKGGKFSLQPSRHVGSRWVAEDPCFGAE